jgi:hypothetical protein
MAEELIGLDSLKKKKVVMGSIMMRKSFDSTAKNKHVLE